MDLFDELMVCAENNTKESNIAVLEEAMHHVALLGPEVDEQYIRDVIASVNADK